MPGVGKSTIGQRLAWRLGRGFVDTDAVIERQEGRFLQDIIDSDGLAAFLTIEEQAVLSLAVSGHVVATGGSVVYSARAMAHLKEHGILIYLKVPFDEIRARVVNESERGLVMTKGQDLLALYEERTPVYEAHADSVIDCAGKNVEEIVRKIAAFLDAA
jgi:shikimate kinase